jgi:hypothetical protein
MTLPLRTWTKIGTPSGDLIAGGNHLYGISRRTGDIWRWDGTPYRWTRIGDPGKMFVAGIDALYGLSRSRQDVYRYNGTPNNWTKIGGPFATLIAGGSHLYGIRRETDDIWQWDGTPSQWVLIGGPGNKFVAGIGALYRLDQQGVSRYEGTPHNWKGIGEAVTIIAGDNRFLYVTKLDGDIWQWNATKDEWINIGDPGNMVVAGTDALYRLDRQGVSRYEGIPYHWTKIGDPADTIAAGGDYLYALSPGINDVLAWKIR